MYSLFCYVQIKDSLDVRSDFSAVQFRYGGAKGVVSLFPEMTSNIDLHIRDSMQKFQSPHDWFEVCKLSAPRPIFSQSTSNSSSLISKNI